VLAAWSAASGVDTPYTRISRLASSLSDGEPAGALEAFDKKMPGYAEIAANIEALAAQNEVLCSIDVVTDREGDNDAADIHHLDLDWYMMLKSRSDNALVERRRLRVAVTLGRKAGVWRIDSLAPASILAPAAIR
jgi:hypothetical protein